MTLPKGELLDNSHIDTICTRVNFAAGHCPAGSRIGSATATTPLLDQPVSGGVYLRASSHRLPDMVLDLRGQVDVVLSARVDSVKGRLRTTFSSTPDVPVSKVILTLAGGKKGLLLNSEGLCGRSKKATATMVGQNGIEHDRRSSCRPTAARGRAANEAAHETHPSDRDWRGPRRHPRCSAGLRPGSAKLYCPIYLQRCLSDWFNRRHRLGGWSGSLCKRSGAAWLQPGDESAPRRAYDRRRPDLPVQRDRGLPNRSASYPRTPRSNPDELNTFGDINVDNSGEPEGQAKANRAASTHFPKVRPSRPGNRRGEPYQPSGSGFPINYAGDLWRRGRAGRRSLGCKLGRSRDPGVRSLDRQSKYRRSRRRSHSHPGDLQPGDRLQRKLLRGRRKRPDPQIQQCGTASRRQSIPTTACKGKRKRSRSTAAMTISSHCTKASSKSSTQAGPWS